MLAVIYLIAGRPSSPEHVAALMAAGAPRCEIEIGPERCPGMPTFEPAKTQLVFNDDWDGSGRNLDRCLQRAGEFASACKSTSPVTARYFLGKQLVQAHTRK